MDKFGRPINILYTAFEYDKRGHHYTDEPVDPRQAGREQGI